MPAPRFALHERVRIFLYTHAGQPLGAIAGKIGSEPQHINVAREGQPPRYKTLYQVVEIQGYARPHEDPALAAAGESEAVTEGWFAEDDMMSLDQDTPPTNPILLGVSLS